MASRLRSPGWCSVSATLSPSCSMSVGCLATLQSSPSASSLAPACARLLRVKSVPNSSRPLGRRRSLQGGSGVGPIQTIEGRSQRLGRVSTVCCLSPEQISRDLGPEDAGQDVFNLQNWLSQSGYLQPEHQTGFYGEKTLAAVSSWQQDAGLPVTGSVGPLTRARINSLSSMVATGGAVGFSTLGEQGSMDMFRGLPSSSASELRESSSASSSHTAGASSSIMDWVNAHSMALVSPSTCDSASLSSSMLDFSSDMPSVKLAAAVILLLAAARAACSAITSRDSTVELRAASPNRGSTSPGESLLASSFLLSSWNKSKSKPQSPSPAQSPSSLSPRNISGNLSPRPIRRQAASSGSTARPPSSSPPSPSPKLLPGPKPLAQPPQATPQSVTLPDPFRLLRRRRRNDTTTTSSSNSSPSSAPSPTLAPGRARGAAGGRGGGLQLTPRTPLGAPPPPPSPSPPPTSQAPPLSPRAVAFLRDKQLLHKVEEATRSNRILREKLEKVEQMAASKAVSAEHLETLRGMILSLRQEVHNRLAAKESDDAVVGTMLQSLVGDVAELRSRHALAAQGNADSIEKLWDKVNERVSDVESETRTVRETVMSITRIMEDMTQRLQVLEEKWTQSSSALEDISHRVVSVERWFGSLSQSGAQELSSQAPALSARVGELQRVIFVAEAERAAARQVLDRRISSLEEAVQLAPVVVLNENSGEAASLALREAVAMLDAKIAATEARLQSDLEVAQLNIERRLAEAELTHAEVGFRPDPSIIAFAQANSSQKNLWEIEQRVAAIERIVNESKASTSAIAGGFISEEGSRLLDTLQSKVSTFDSIINRMRLDEGMLGELRRRVAGLENLLRGEDARRPIGFSPGPVLTEPEPPQLSPEDDEGPYGAGRRLISGREIVLQGFNWESHKHGWLQQLLGRVGDIADAGFTSVWLPPPTQSLSPQGYLPQDLWNLNSCYGDKYQLHDLVQGLKSRGICAIADVVINHRCATNKGKTGKWNRWDDVPMPWDETCVVPDETFEGLGNPKAQPLFQGVPNVDHSQLVVRDDIKKWLKWMIKEVGFSGFRFDFAKGYSPEYVREYLQATGPEFAVGEYWDTCLYNGETHELAFNQDAHRQRTIDWLDGTLGLSAAFDFTTKAVLQEAVKGEYWRLKDKHSRPAGVIGMWPGRSVTFIDSHDTGSTQKCWEFPAEHVGQGYAYIFTHPGIPCVLWDHAFEWGYAMGDEIRALIQLRRRAAIHSRSSVQILHADDRKYVALTDDKIYIKLGDSPWEPEGAATGIWVQTLKGTKYTIWERS